MAKILLLRPIDREANDKARGLTSTHKSNHCTEAKTWNTSENAVPKLRILASLYNNGLSSYRGCEEEPINLISNILRHVGFEKTAAEV